MADPSHKRTVDGHDDGHDLSKQDRHANGNGYNSSREPTTNQPQQHASRTNDNIRQKTTTTVAYNNQDEDDDSECWDDAKALLNNDDDYDAAVAADDNDASGGRRHQMMDCDTVDGVTFTETSSSTTTFQPASSSSAYSSLQSSNNANPAASAAMTVGGAPADDLILHEAVFKNDRETIMAILNDTQLIKQRGLANKRDKHGNTALHLACMLGRSKEIIAALLQNRDGVKWASETKNLNRWTPFHEACSYGNREVISLLARQLKDDVDDALRNSNLLNFLEKTKNYRLVLKWEFQTWVPLVSRVLPSDVCVINKQGKFIRIDTRLLDLEGLFRKKGDCCLVYSDKKWVVMNNKTKKYQYFEPPTATRDLEDRVDEFMATDIMDLELKSSEMQLTRSTSGWIWKADKVGKVGRFNAALYDFTNVFLVTRKRREHLSEDDLKRNKLAYKSAVHVFKFGERPGQREEVQRQDSSGENELTGDSGPGEGESDDGEDDEDEVVHRESLPPPPPTKVTWEEYINSEPGNHPTLGREHKVKVTKTAVKASVAMSEEFPLTKMEFLDLLSVVPIKMFKKLKEFVEMKLPEGFPVRLDIPVFPFLTARITFEDFAFHEGPVDESLFRIPQDYEEDTNLLPRHFKNSNNNSNHANSSGATNSSTATTPSTQVEAKENNWLA